MNTMDWIITFDISSGASRTAVNKILNLYGIRILYTVYHIAADSPVIDRIIDDVRPYVASGDHLLALPTCEQCRAAHLGQTIEELLRDVWIAS